MKKFITLLVILIKGILPINAQERNLDFYIGKAKENSPLLNQSKNEMKIISLDLEQMNKVLYKPEINLVSGFTLSPIINNTGRFQLASEGASDYIGHDLAITDGGSYQAMVSLKQQLLSGAKYTAYQNKADISRQIAENNITLTVHELEQAVSYQYILCIKSSKQAEISLSILKSLEEQYKLIQALVNNGVYKQTDLILMQIELENYNLEYKAYGDEYSSNIRDLNLLCGIRDTTTVALANVDFRIKTEMPVKSGFLASFMLDSLKVLSDQSIDELKYKPQLYIFTEAGLNAAYLPYPRRFGLSAGMSFTWNIFDGHQRDITREKSAIELQNIEFNKTYLTTQNEIKRKKVLDRINLINGRIQMNEKLADRYDTLKQAYLKELSMGETSIMDFKNLLKDISIRNLELLQLMMERQFLINSYNYLNF